MSEPNYTQLLRHYFAGSQWTITEGLSGWNNTTRFVEAGGRRWVLRIYETHKEIGKVLFEHEILLALNGMKLEFRVPNPVRTIDGNTYVTLADGSGRLACLFSYIEGHRPEENDPDIAFAFGRAAGQLSRALQGVETSEPPKYPPYYEMDSAHPLCTPDKVRSFCSEPPPEFGKLSEALSAIGEAIRAMRASLPHFRTLPHQLIHGDINHSNALLSEEGGKRIEAILDFEFCTRDLRVMEIAVIVSGLLNEARSGDSIERFLEGAGEQLHFGIDEAEAIPKLVELRILDVFLHFLGRYWDGVDGAEVVREQTLSAYEVLRRLRDDNEQLLRLCRRYLCEL